MKFFLSVTLFLCVVSASAQTAKEWRDSVSYLSQLIEQNPRSLELRMRKAEANIALEQWQYALDEYSNILDLHPTHIGALYFRAFVNGKLRRYNFARADYEKVLTYEPGHEGALSGLVRVELADNHLQKAYDKANLLLELYPNNARHYLLHSQVEEALGYYDVAVADVTTAIEMEMDRISASQRLSFNDDLTQYVLRRTELRKRQMEAIKKKKSDKQFKTLIENDINFLISKGVPSRALRKYK